MSAHLIAWSLHGFQLVFLLRIYSYQPRHCSFGCIQFHADYHEQNFFNVFIQCNSYHISWMNWIHMLCIMQSWRRQMNSTWTCMILVGWTNRSNVYTMNEDEIMGNNNNSIQYYRMASGEWSLLIANIIKNHFRDKKATFKILDEEFEKCSIKCAKIYVNISNICLEFIYIYFANSNCDKCDIISSETRSRTKFQQQKIVYIFNV